MQFQGLSLQNFRSYSTRTFLFPKRTTIIVAKNASGKTSLIEAISLLSTGESFRAEHVAEMIQFNQEYARVKGKISQVVVQKEMADDDDEPATPEEIELEVLLTNGMLQGKKVQSRLYSVNNVRRRKKDFVGKFFTVVFRPEDMRLIEGSPTRRRQFIDTVLSVSDEHYAVALKTYEDGLKRRNRLLSQVQEGKAPRSVLVYWTNLLLKHGEVLQEKRRQFFGFFSEVEFPLSFSVQYEPSVISAERLEEYAEREVFAGHTLIGPHKDDFSVHLLLQDGGMHNIAQYGSRGQQRMAVLWLKTAELQFLKQEVKFTPLLLLDDILSELDENHRHHVLFLLEGLQSIITTTEERMVEEIQQVAGDVDVLRLS